ncbi:MAG: M48 family metalloprotease [Bacteriovoracaceae bacterium]|nr:M48 family metalloprotease [Bacteriovoracaceae bacterium]
MGIKKKIEQEFLKVDLKEYKERFRNNLGELLNPPELPIRPDIEDAINAIETIVMDLAGPWIEKQANKLVISIFSSKEKNAFALANSELTKSPPVFDERPYMLREIWGAQKNNQPVFEIGVTVGLLQGNFTTDELAFVLAHELSHLMEGHVHHENDYDYRSNFYSSQVEELAADTAAIQLMMGKYNPKAAYTALNKILSENEDEEKESVNPLNEDPLCSQDILDGLKNGISSHHHPGVRLGSIQTYLKYLQFQGEWKSIENEVGTKIPSFPYDEKSPKEETKIVKKLITNFFENLEELFFEGEIFQPEAFSHFAGRDDYFLVIETIEADAYHYCCQFVEKLSHINRTKTEKFLSFLLFLTWCHRYHSDSEITSDQSNILSSFLNETTEGLTVEDFEQSQDFIDCLQKYHRRFLDYCFSKSSECFFKDSTKHLDSWRNFLEVFITTSQKEIKTSSTIETLTHYYQTYRAFETSFTFSSLIREVYTDLDKNIDTNQFTKDFFSLIPGESHQHFTQILSHFRPYALQKNREENDEGIYEPLPSQVSIYNSLIAQFSSWPGNVLGPGSTIEIIECLNFYSGFLESLNDCTREGDLEYPTLGLLHFQNCFFHSSYITKGEHDSTGYSYNYLFKQYINHSSKQSLISSENLHQLSLFLALYDPSENMFINLSKESEIKWRPFLTKTTLEDMKRFLEDLPSCLDNLEAIDDYGQLTLKLNYFVNSFQLLSAWTHANESKELFTNAAYLKKMIFSLREIVALKERREEHPNHNGWEESIILSRYSQETFSEALITLIDSVDYKDWFQVYMLFCEFGFSKSHFSEDQYIKTSKYLFEVLKNEFSRDELIVALTDKKLRNLLHSHEFCELLLTYIKEKCPIEDRDFLKSTFRKINNDLHLDVQFTEVFLDLRNQVVQYYQIQPNELESVFPPDRRSLTEKLIGFSMKTRYFSAICSVFRSREFTEQFELMSYLMGRIDVIPEFIKEVHNDVLTETDGRYGLLGPLLNFKAELNHRSTVERAYILNCLITGYGGMAQDEEGQRILIDDIKESFPDEQKELVENMAQALIETDGHDCSLFLSYIFAQPPKGNLISKTQVFGAILESFGVPGQKLAQYLAFTNSFKEYYESFKDFQDSVNPVNHFEVLSLIKARFSNSWPDHLKIIKTIGSGTVNLAVLIKNTQTNENQVLSIARKGIQDKTLMDFDRFKSFIDHLDRISHGKKEFRFIKGLVDVIKESVELEFDKVNSAKMQEMALEHYSSRDHKVETVPVYENFDHALLMGHAFGETAKVILEQDLDKYVLAMTHLFEAEWNVLSHLLSESEVESSSFANPDMHDGQVIVNDNQVFVIDFGQAVEVTKEDCLEGFAIAKIISGLFSPEKAHGILSNETNLNANKITISDLTEVLAFDDKMERFVNLLSITGERDEKIALGPIHWVLAVNRLYQLSEKIDVSFEAKITKLYLAQNSLLENLSTFFNKAS